MEHKHDFALEGVCRACITQNSPVKVRLGGPLSIPFRLMGAKRSSMNPNVCSMCTSHFETDTDAHAVTTEVTVLFADLRGYTSYSTRAASEAVIEVLDRFYGTASRAVWQQDGVVNKFIGDAVLAFYGFPIVREDHALLAVESGLELQRRSADVLRSIGADHEADAPAGIGVGVHTGMATIGLIGTTSKDPTAIGETVNLASRLQSAAQPGEVLVTEVVYQQVKEKYPGAEAREQTFKGIEGPMTVYALRPA